MYAHRSIQMTSQAPAAQRTVWQLRKLHDSESTCDIIRITIEYRWTLFFYNDTHLCVKNALDQVGKIKVVSVTVHSGGVAGTGGVETHCSRKIEAHLADESLEIKVVNEIG